MMDHHQQINCSKCNNDGYYYDPKDRDHIEGYKLANPIVCDCEFGCKHTSNKYKNKIIDLLPKLNNDDLLEIRDRICKM